MSLYLVPKPDRATCAECDSVLVWHEPVRKQVVPVPYCPKCDGCADCGHFAYEHVPGRYCGVLGCACRTFRERALVATI